MLETWENIINSKEGQAVILGLLVFVGFMLCRRSIRKLEQIAAKTATTLDDRLISFWKKFYIFILLTVLVVGLLRIFEVDITPLMAGAGVASLIIGLAIKEILADIFSGISLITDRPFTEGDRIQVTKISGHWGGWGDVRKIGLRRTTVENTDGVTVNYPNSMLAQSAIINFSDKNDELKPVRVRVRFSVDWSVDLERALEVARQALCEGVEMAREQGFAVSKIDTRLPIGGDKFSETINTTPSVLVRSIWDDARGQTSAGILLEGRYFLRDVRDRTKVRSIVLRQIFESLRQERIPLPSPAFTLSHEGEPEGLMEAD